MLINQLADSITLEGSWQFSLGESLNWGQITVPGCWEAQGYSKFPDGPAIFRRRVDIPLDWAGRIILLEFAAVSYACVVKVNGRIVGDHKGLWTPFQVNVTSAARTGETNLIELEVFKPGDRFPMRGCLAGFLPDVATSFGGIWQPAYLRSLTVGLEDFLVDPDPDSGQVRVRCRAQGLEPFLRSGSWRIEVYSGENLVMSREVQQSGGSLAEASFLDVEVVVPTFQRWSPENPALYELRLELSLDGEPAARASQRFGFRRLEARAGLVLLNGQPILLRGVLSWGWRPEQIAPAYTAGQAREEIRRVKAMGFNLIKLCLFVPDQTYFDIADEEGILLWEELPLWLPEVTDELRVRAPKEYAEIARLARHHPSVVLYSLGCELSQSVDAALLDSLNQAVRSLVAQVLVCDNSGSGESYGGLDFDFSDFSDYHPYYDLHYFEPLLDNWRRDWLPPRPWIFGEFSDSDGFRDLEELRAASGGQKPWWLSEENPISTWRTESLALVEVEERLARLDLPFDTAELVNIAAAQSLVARKYTLETLRRRNGMGGYVITGLRDTPIATSGVFDDFDRPKWPAEVVQHFNGEAILCLDTGRRRAWTNGGDRPDRLDVYNHWGGPGSTANWHIILSSFTIPQEGAGKITWSLRDEAGVNLAGGRLAVNRVFSPGFPCEVAAFSCDLPQVSHACQLFLEVRLDLPGLAVENAWPVWVYPPVHWPAGVGIFDPGCALDSLNDLLIHSIRLRNEERWAASLVIATDWNEALNEHLHRGGQALLLQQGSGPLPSRRGPFWREGLKLFLPHPIWEMFPQQGFADLQFFGLAGDVILEPSRLAETIPGVGDIRPVLRRLDEREFTQGDYILEARVGAGKVLVCSLPVQGGAGAQPSGLKRNVAGAYLLWAMLAYLGNL